ncbi:protein phosphatase 2C domain-containing protein [Micromonospora sp. DT81.3]|uniref:protein phosphatase 2C domain-containing protein n=1 Tax=Micromonospora sp. DT81.3 TaxID=3416523 RepID=UPI003CF9DA5F
MIRDSGSLYAVTASIRGTAHRGRDVENQDRVLTVGRAGVVLICLADGLGSAASAGTAAQVAVNEAMAVLISFLPSPGLYSSVDNGTNRQSRGIVVPTRRWAVPDPSWRRIVVTAVLRARVAVLRTAREYGAAVRDFGTTLSVVAVTKDGVHAAQVGDGFVVIWPAEHPADAVVLGKADPLEVDPSRTATLTSVTRLADVELDSVAFSRDSRLLVSTDGLAPIVFRSWLPREPGPRILGAITREMDAGRMSPSEVRAWLDSDAVIRRTDDDKSIALVGRGFRSRRRHGSSGAQQLTGRPIMSARETLVSREDEQRSRLILGRSPAVASRALCGTRGEP